MILVPSAAHGGHTRLPPWMIRSSIFGAGSPPPAEIIALKSVTPHPSRPPLHLRGIGRHRWLLGFMRHKSQRDQSDDRGGTE
jgi:hypothetical protein